MNTKLFAAVMCLLFHVMVCELRFAFTFWRHGCRTPNEVNSQNVDILGSQWANPGELLPTGMRMHYLLGLRNRNRWSGYLSSSYDVKEIYVKSTDYNRTIMSALSNLQGLYPPSTGPSLTVGQDAKALPPVTSTLFTAERVALNGYALRGGVQVIPIHVMPKTDPYNWPIYGTSYCPSVFKEVLDNDKSDINQNIVKSINTKWGSKLKQALKLTDENWLLSFNNLNLIADSFISGYVADQPLKSFTDAGINLEEFLEDAHEIEFNNMFYYYNGDANQMYSKMYVTSFFENMFRWMDTRVLYDQQGKGYTGFAAPKLAMFSSHDITLAAAQTLMAKAFNIGTFYKTPFASSFIFELFRPDNKVASSLVESDYTVKVTYNELNYLTLSYPEFKSKLQPFLLTKQEYDEYCGWTQQEIDLVPTSYIDATIVLSCLLFVAVIGLIVLLILLLKKPKQGQVLQTDKVMPTV